MSLEDIRSRLPEYAKDLKLNLSLVLSDENLTEQQRYGTLLASALAAGEPDLIKAAETEASNHLTAEAVNAAKAAASIMAMNNIYYRFAHLASAPDYKTLPAGLRMNVIGRPGIEKTDFELFALAVSAINGCGMCIDSHESLLRKEGLSLQAIQTSIRIASVVHAVARTLAGERALAS